jgi:hypothetical protein
LFSFDLEAVREAGAIVKQAFNQIDRRGLMTVEIASFTTSPALGAVASQYAAYLGGHPGSLQVATEAVTKNLEFLHTSMTRLADALTKQEDLAEKCFITGPGLIELPDGLGKFVLPNRTHVPILDLGYLAPVAATEATTPLSALTAMFAGSDGAVIAAADAWTEAGTRMTGVVDALTSAGSLLAATTEGEAFDAAQKTIAEVAKQGTVIAMNSTAMGTAMAELVPIRASAHAQLVALEAEADSRKAAIAAAGATNPAAAASAPAALAAAETQTQAEVAAFVSSYLQPALDTARPRVTNLGVEVVGHTGGDTLTTGATATLPPGEVATQVAGGATASGQTTAASPMAAAPQSAGTTGAPSAPPAGSPAPAGQMGQVATAPAGGPVPAPAAATTGDRAATALVPPAGRPTPTATAGAVPTGQTAAMSPTTAPARPATPAAGRGGTMGRATTGSPRGAVVQPLLPRSVTGTGAAPGTGPGPGAGRGPVSGGATGVPGATGARPFGGPGGPGGSGGPGSHGGLSGPGPVTGTAAGGGAGAGTRGGGVPVGGGIGGPAGGRGGAGRTGRKPGTSPFAAGPKTSKRDLVADYFRRQFFGKKPRTVKKVIR